MSRPTESSYKDIEARTRYDWSTTSPSKAVIDTVADVVGGDATSFGPLYDRIDPDALDSLFRSDGPSQTLEELEVSFSLADRLIVVHGDGDVVVRPTTRNEAER